MTDQQVLEIGYLNNGSKIRQLYLHADMVMIVTPRSHAPSPNYALPRFLPRQVSQIVIAYLTNVAPFLEMMDLEPPIMRGEKEYLFDYVGSIAWLTFANGLLLRVRKTYGIGHRCR
jgi:hypothetical protein